MTYKKLSKPQQQTVNMFKGNTLCEYLYQNEDKAKATCYISDLDLHYHGILWQRLVSIREIYLLPRINLVLMSVD